MGIINHKLNKYNSLAPGPGAYEPKPQIREKSLSYSMAAITESKEREAEKKSMFPGPGKYEPKVGYLSENKY